jgi:hypothetical protein
VKGQGEGDGERERGREREHKEWLLKAPGVKKTVEE